MRAGQARIQVRKADEMQDKSEGDGKIERATRFNKNAGGGAAEGRR